MDRNLFRIGRAWFFTVAVLLVFLPWVWDIRSVEGRSMEPGYPPGKVVVTLRWAYGIPQFLDEGYLFRWSAPSPGDVVVIKTPPGDHFALKRVKNLWKGTREEVYVLGDNPGVSRDSRDFGPLPVEDVLGKVVF